MGKIGAKRDWRYAKEFVKAIWLMQQQPEADDYVIATNQTPTIRECLKMAFGRLGLDWQKYVEIDSRHHLPGEVELLIGDGYKAKRKIGWERRTKFKDLIELMVDADLALIQNQLVG
jgi:GDPmannose 4,6-dehydratase